MHIGAKIFLFLWCYCSEAACKALEFFALSWYAYSSIVVSDQCISAELFSVFPANYQQIKHTWKRNQNNLASIFEVLLYLQSKTGEARSHIASTSTEKCILRLAGVSRRKPELYFLFPPLHADYCWCSRLLIGRCTRTHGHLFALVLCVFASGVVMV